MTVPPPEEKPGHCLLCPLGPKRPGHSWCVNAGQDEPTARAWGRASMLPTQPMLEGASHPQDGPPWRRRVHCCQPWVFRKVLSAGSLPGRSSQGLTPASWVRSHSGVSPREQGKWGVASWVAPPNPSLPVLCSPSGEGVKDILLFGLTFLLTEMFACLNFSYQNRMPWPPREASVLLPPGLPVGASLLFWDPLF